MSERPPLEESSSPSADGERGESDDGCGNPNATTGLFEFDSEEN